MALKDGCAQASAIQLKVLRDKAGGRSEVRIRNDNPNLDDLKVYLVDGCLITEGPRCDYLVLPNSGAVALVELKGSDVEYAITQICKTFDVLAADLNARKRYAVIVPSRCPLVSSGLARAQDHLARVYRCTLRVKNCRFECRTSDFG